MRSACSSDPTRSCPVLTFRLPTHFKQTIDDWRSAEPDKPSRSEAIRWLIGKGLKAELQSRKK